MEGRRRKEGGEGGERGGRENRREKKIGERRGGEKHCLLLSLRV